MLAASGRAPHLSETKEEFVARLAGEGMRRQAVLQAIDNVHMSRYTFKPSINGRSRAVRAVHWFVVTPPVTRVLHWHASAFEPF